MQTSNVKAKSTHRYRICGTPSRGGCLTCKIRRVKCGEEKPFCNRCTSTGRKCDGYTPLQTSKTSVPKPLPNPSRLNPVEDPMEQRLLQYFGTHSAPSLSGFFSTDFWEHRVVQASHTELSVRHAVIAIAAMHQEFNQRHTKTGREQISQLQAFAFRQYTKAISSLHYLMSTRMPPLDLTLISCILFASIDCLLGNHASAIIHLKAGTRILADIKQHKSHKGIRAEEWEREFAPPLLALGVQAATFVNPHLQAERTALWVALSNTGDASQPAAFYSLDTARYALDSISARVMADRTSTESILEHKPPDPALQGRMHNAALDTWNEAMEKFIVDYAKEETPTSKTRCAASLLKVHSLVISIVIGRPEDATVKFDHLISLCEYLDLARKSSGAALTFSTDQRMIAPLFFTALRAPNQDTKLRAINLLSKAPAREGMWDADDAIRVAEGAHSDIQNIGGFVLNALLPESIPQGEIKIWNDIASRLKSRMTWPFGERAPGRSPSPTASSITSPRHYMASPEGQTVASHSRSPEDIGMQ